jgi:hypothetical protein
MSIPSNWEHQISRRFGTKTIIEVVVDPGGTYETILNGDHDLIDLPPLINRIDLDPDMRSQMYFPDLQLTFNDATQVYHAFSKRNSWQGFRDTHGLLSAANTSNSATIKFNGDRARGFQVGDMIAFAGGTNTDITFVTATSWSGDNQVIEFDTISNTYSENDLVTTFNIANKEVLIRMKIDGYDDAYNLYRGIAQESFRWVDGKATLNLTNKLKVTLNRKMTGIGEYIYVAENPSLGIDGYYYGSGVPVGGTTNTSENGTLNTGLIDFYTGILIGGTWKIEFTSATDFKVTGPTINEKAGDINTDFYDQTDATDSQIKIDSGTWGGTYASGDTIQFTVTEDIGGNPARCLSLLLRFYAGLSASNIDYDLLSDAIDVAEASGIYAEILFDKSMTVMEAITYVLPLYNMYLSAADDKIRVLTFDNDFNQTKTVGSIKKIKSVNKFNPINKFSFKYDWDSTTETYQREDIYPFPDNLNKSANVFDTYESRLIRLYGLDTKSQVDTLAEMYYSTFSMGIHIVELTCFIDALDINVGNRIVLDDEFEPGQIEFIVIGTRKNLFRSNTITLTCAVWTDEYGDLT